MDQEAHPRDDEQEERRQLIDLERKRDMQRLRRSAVPTEMKSKRFTITGTNLSSLTSPKMSRLSTNEARIVPHPITPVIALDRIISEIAR